MGDLRAQARQLDEVTGGLAHAVGNIAHVGDLAAHVEVQQVQAIGVFAVTQGLPQVQHLARGQPELGLVTTAVLPLAGAQAGQAHAHAQAGLDVQCLGLFQHQLQLRRLLDHDEGLQAELAPDQRQADVFPVLVAIADNQPTRARQRQHRHQLRLGTGLQAKALAVVGGQGAGHATVLVDLDRIHGRVTPAVVPIGLGLGKGRLQLAQALVEDVRKAHQHRQPCAIGARGSHDLRQGHRRAGRAGWFDHDVAFAVHIKIAIRPVRDGIGLAGLVGGPIAHRRKNSVVGERRRILPPIAPHIPIQSAPAPAPWRGTPGRVKHERAPRVCQRSSKAVRPKRHPLLPMAPRCSRNPKASLQETS